HAGHQTVANNSAVSYSDWKVGVTKDFGVVTGSLAVIGTNLDVYASNGSNLGKAGLVLSVAKTF
ncbi:MAG TPA: TorF family putative porin, partial [Burkholderiaceae bacterium]|nr:TorF family putative porin [Burkholderiaceae bacterium]